MSARWRSIAVLLLGLAAAATGDGTALAASADAGEALARTHCARCHVLPGEGNMGLGSTPSFKIMVTSPIADWRERFESFYALRPHPNFVRIRELPWTVESLPVAAPFTLSLADIADLMAYVDRLAAEYRK